MKQDVSVHQFHTIENSHPNRAYHWASHGTFMYLGSCFHFCTWKVQEIRRTPIQLMEAKIQARTPTPDMKFNTSCFSLKPFPRFHLNNYAYTRMDIGKLTQRIGSPDKPIALSTNFETKSHCVSPHLDWAPNCHKSLALCRLNLGKNNPLDISIQRQSFLAKNWHIFNFNVHILRPQPTSALHKLFTWLEPQSILGSCVCSNACQSASHKVPTQSFALHSSSLSRQIWSAWHCFTFIWIMAVQSKSQNLEQGDQKGHRSATSLGQTWDTCIHFTDSVQQSSDCSIPIDSRSAEEQLEFAQCFHPLRTNTWVCHAFLLYCAMSPLWHSLSIKSSSYLHCEWGNLLGSRLNQLFILWIGALQLATDGKKTWSTLKRKCLFVFGVHMINTAFGCGWSTSTQGNCSWRIMSAGCRRGGLSMHKNSRPNTAHQEPMATLLKNNVKM